jgi:hypothetical protein
MRWVSWISAIVTSVHGILTLFLKESRPSQILKKRLRQLNKATTCETPFTIHTPDQSVSWYDFITNSLTRMHILEFMFSYLDVSQILALLNTLPFELLATSGTSKFPNQVNLAPRLPRSNPSLHRANRLPSHNNIPHRLRTNLHPYRSIASGLHAKSPILHQRTRLPPFHPHRYRAKPRHHSPLLRPQPPKMHEIPS